MKILLSIHNEHIQKIKQGTKKFEFRKVMAKNFSNGEMIIYATSPICKVIGIAVIKTIHIDTPANIWAITKQHAGINETVFYTYYNKKNKAVAYEIEQFIEFDQPKELTEFGVKIAPQSFVYVK